MSVYADRHADAVVLCVVTTATVGHTRERGDPRDVKGPCSSARLSIEPGPLG
jgi:hypothetical protein